MIEGHYWILFGAFILLAAQQFRIYRIQRNAGKREELFQILTENAADMIALVDVKGHRLYNSPAYKRILGYSAAELGETSAFEQIHPDDRFKVLEAAREARETGVGKKLEYRIRHKNGTWRVFESTASAIRDVNGDVVKLVIVNRDITDRRRAEDQLQHNAFHDALTGLPNRRLFLDRLEHLFTRARRNPASHHAVLLVDVDGFKAVNHSLGTSVGDQVLAEIGGRIKPCLRQNDTVSHGENQGAVSDAVLARFGGDEFTILLDAIAGPSDAMRVAKRIATAISEPLFVEGQELKVSASIGIALSHQGQARAEELLQDADVAMRRAKALGGSRCEVLDEAMHTQAVNRLALETELRTAIDHRQFRVFYQPIVELRTKQIAGFEALLRWHHPKQGLVSPDKFLEAAEDTGLLVYIGHWLVVEACRRLREWQSKNPFGEPLTISVNLSSRQFRDARLAGDVRDALQEAGIEPAQLRLELTENVAMADPRLTATVVAQLKQSGIGVILDNFGAGLASLRSLRHFPMEGLKIDRSLVNEMASDRASHDLVSAMVILAHKMNIKVIAEGIESARQLERLRELECDFGQGFLFSQPVEAEAVEALLRQRSLLGQPKTAGA